MSEIEQRRKEAAKFECIPLEWRDRPTEQIAIGVTKGGKWIWGPPDSPILKKRKERSDKGKKRGQTPAVQET